MGVLSSTSGQSAAHRPALLARNGRSMRAGECLFLGEKRSCSGHHCTARRRAQAIVAHVAAVKAARTGIALCRAQVAVSNDEMLPKSGAVREDHHADTTQI